MKWISGLKPRFENQVQTWTAWKWKTWKWKAEFQVYFKKSIDPNPTSFVTAGQWNYKGATELHSKNQINLNSIFWPKKVYVQFKIEIFLIFMWFNHLFSEDATIYRKFILFVHENMNKTYPNSSLSGLNWVKKMNLNADLLVRFSNVGVLIVLSKLLFF